MANSDRLGIGGDGQIGNVHGGLAGTQNDDIGVDTKLAPLLDL